MTQEDFSEESSGTNCQRSLRTEPLGRRGWGDFGWDADGSFENDVNNKVRGMLWRRRRLCAKARELGVEGFMKGAGTPDHRYPPACLDTSKNEESWIEIDSKTGKDLQIASHRTSGICEAELLLKWMIREPRKLGREPPVV